MNIRQAISSVRNLRESLANYDTFFEEYHDHWLQMLRNLTLDHTLQLRPDTADPEEWIEFAENLATRIESFFGEETVTFQLTTRDLVGDPDFELEDLTKTQVEDWVRAGLIGDPLGKNILDTEYWKTDDAPEKIANSVYHIIKKGRSAGIWDSLREYTSTRVATGTDDLLEQILSEWLAIMSVTAKDDFQQWVANQVSASFS